jgi:hypothetical protein
MADKVMIIPRAEGDVDKGGALYLPSSSCGRSPFR